MWSMFSGSRKRHPKLQPRFSASEKVARQRRSRFLAPEKGNRQCRAGISTPEKPTRSFVRNFRLPKKSPDNIVRVFRLPKKADDHRISGKNPRPDPPRNAGWFSPPRHQTHEEDGRQKSPRRDAPIHAFLPSSENPSVPFAPLRLCAAESSRPSDGMSEWRANGPAHASPGQSEARATAWVCQRKWPKG